MLGNGSMVYCCLIYMNPMETEWKPLEILIRYPSCYRVNSCLFQVQNEYTLPAIRQVLFISILSNIMFQLKPMEISEGNSSLKLSQLLTQTIEMETL